MVSATFGKTSSVQKYLNPRIRLRTAGPEDLAIVQSWDKQPHVIAAGVDDDWNWPEELQRNPPGREQLLAELDGHPLGFLQIIDPAIEETHYWGEVPDNYRAIDIWIGDAGHLGKGYGSTMMELAIERCFADPNVRSILIDPLVTNVRAQRFYQKMGFRFISNRVFGEDECAVHQLDRTDWEKSE